LDENERDIVEDDLEQEAAPEEVPEEQPSEEAPAQNNGEQDEEEGEKESEEEESEEEEPTGPVKGPGAGAWLMASLMVLLGLVLAAPAMWNAGLGFRALSGLLQEAGKNHQSALSTYQLMLSTDARTGGWYFLDRELGLDCGTYALERQYSVLCKLNGPLNTVQSVRAGETPSIRQLFGETPKSLRKLAAQLDILFEIFERLDVYLMSPPLEGETQSQWVLAGLDAARASDEQGEERGLYYNSLALHFTADDPDQKLANLARIAALKQDPAAEPWMYWDTEFVYAVKDRDYAAVIGLCNASLKNNREDFMSMLYKVKALYRNGEEDKAFAAAESFAGNPAAADTVKLAKAALYAFQGKYELAILQCDEILNQINLPAEQSVIRTALDATSAKATTLMLLDRPDEARDLLLAGGNTAQMYGFTPGPDYVHTLLAALLLAGDTQEAEDLLLQLGAVPQSILDLQEGKTTIQEIFSDGWGGFDK